MPSLKQYIKAGKSFFAQSMFNVQCLKQAKKIVLFLLPSEIFKSGGILSIFSLCKTSRALLPASQVVLATFPGKKTYAKRGFLTLKEAKLHEAEMG